jgi:hypothetical protein
MIETKTKQTSLHIIHYPLQLLNNKEPNLFSPSLLFSSWWHHNCQADMVMETYRCDGGGVEGARQPSWPSINDLMPQWHPSSWI